MQRGPLAEHGGQRIRVILSEFLGGGLVAKPPHQVTRPAEGLFQRHLLVQQHADEQRERVARKQLVSVGIDRQRYGHGSLLVAAAILAGCGGARETGMPQNLEAGKLGAAWKHAQKRLVRNYVRAGWRFTYRRGCRAVGRARISQHWPAGNRIHAA